MNSNWKLAALSTCYVWICWNEPQRLMSIEWIFIFFSHDSWVFHQCIHFRFSMLQNWMEKGLIFLKNGLASDQTLAHKEILLGNTPLEVMTKKIFINEKQWDFRIWGELSFKKRRRSSPSEEINVSEICLRSLIDASAAYRREILYS